MADTLFYASGFVVLLFGFRTYLQYRDAFHPAVFTAPLMAAGYSIWPLILNREGELAYLLGPDELASIQSYYLGALLAFYLGMSWGSRRFLKNVRFLSPWQELARTVRGEVARQRLLRFSLGLGFVAMLAYWSSIQNVGGFGEAYSRFKGGGVSSSGYIGEATLLAYPSALIYALYKQGRGFRFFDWVVVLVILSPNLFQGTLGVRRGPLFISLATLFVCWLIARGRIPGLFQMGLGVSTILAAVVFMWSQRRIWFTDNVDSGGLEKTLLPGTDNLWENDFVSGVGSALITRFYDGFFWGKRWFVDLVIRPIPKQIWATKYEDVGAYWAAGGNPTGFEVDQQIFVLGFPLPRGHSIGVLSDLYSEWWWFALLFLFCFGLFLRWLWLQHRLVGQVWTAVYMAGLGLCIYLPTQSFSAWYQRFLIMAVVTIIGWRWVVGKDVKESRPQRTRTERR